MVKNIDITKKPDDRQIQMLKEASYLPVNDYDEYPEFSEEDLLKFRRISENKRVGRQKQTLTLRISPQALKKAKSLGKGYTSVLSRIIETALDNPEIIKEYL